MMTFEACTFALLVGWFFGRIHGRSAAREGRRRSVDREGRTFDYLPLKLTRAKDIVGTPISIPSEEVMDRRKSYIRRMRGLD